MIDPEHAIAPDAPVIHPDKTREHRVANAGRNIVRSYPLYQLDLGIGKSFDLPREGMRLQFRTEMFNAFNKSNFRNANLNRSTAGFGQVRATFPARRPHPEFACWASLRTRAQTGASGVGGSAAKDRRARP